MNEIEVKASELTAKFEALETEREELKSKVAEMEAKLSAVEAKNNDAEVVQLKADLDKMNESLNELNKKMVKQDVEVKATLEDSLRSVYESAEFKAQFEEVKSGKRAKTEVFEIKTDPTSVILSGMTGDVTRTYASGMIKGALYEPNKFLANMKVVNIPADKNRAMWYDGAYYSNVGYMTELTAITTGDGAAIEEKYRELAKVGARLQFSSESATDMSYFVDWARNKGIEATLNKIDELAWSGAGADVTKPKEVYGLKTKGATAFNAATAGLALAIPDANIADLILAGATQIRISGKGQYVPKLVYLHPSDVAILRTLKNKQADYINIFPDGSILVHGLQVMESAKINAGEMFIATPETMELHQKPGLETELERNADIDGYTLYLRKRYQVVVATTDLVGNVYVSNITTAIAAISAGPQVYKVESVTTTTTAAPTTTTTTTTTGA